jgi:hypothetical protein
VIEEVCLDQEVTAEEKVFGVFVEDKKICGRL